ncbi:MAG: DUF5672 family protein [Tepidisphaeraceae bacterium]
MKRELKDVTVSTVAAVERYPAARALEISMGHCTFGDAILFCHEPLPGRAFRNVKKVPPSTAEVYNHFILKEMYRHIETRFILAIQYDGYVLEPEAWNDGFLQYDYIGARWPDFHDGKDVGNGGFSLRSRRLMEITARDDFEIPPGIGEDELICRVYRERLENAFGIRFAPAETADRFSYENAAPGRSGAAFSYENAAPNWPTFGFHGLGNFWRHVPDAEIGPIFDQLHRYTYQTFHFMQLVSIYMLQGRWIPFRELYGRWRRYASIDEICAHLKPFLPAGSVAQCRAVCQELG